MMSLSFPNFRSCVSLSRSLVSIRKRGQRKHDCCALTEKEHVFSIHFYPYLQSLSVFLLVSGEKIESGRGKGSKRRRGDAKGVRNLASNKTIKKKNNKLKSSVLPSALNIQLTGVQKKPLFLWLILVVDVQDFPFTHDKD